jgi:hypothetical protein
MTPEIPIAIMDRYGARFHAGLLVHRVGRDLRWSRCLRSAEAVTPSWYFVLLVLTWFTVGVGIIALILRLAQSAMAR